MKNVISEKSLSAYLKRQASILYEESVYYYCWFMVSSEYANIIGFPPENMEYGWNDVRDGFKQHFDKSFKKISKDLLKDFMERGGDPYLPNEPEKEFSIGFFLFSDLRDRIKIGEKISFRLCCLDLKSLSILFEHYEQIYNLLKPDLNRDFFIELNELKDEILKEASEIYGYCKAKSDKIKASRPGIEAKRKKAENRINQVKKGVEKFGTITDEGIRISSGQYDDIVRKALGYQETSTKYDRTARTCKNKIEMILSKEKGRAIRIILI